MGTGILFTVQLSTSSHRKGIEGGGGVPIRVLDDAVASTAPPTCLLSPHACSRDKHLQQIDVKASKLVPNPRPTRYSSESGPLLSAVCELVHLSLDLHGVQLHGIKRLALIATSDGMGINHPVSSEIGATTGKSHSGGTFVLWPLASGN
ncbi:hypothetical protein Taro_034437 [Colocasia esculenta]|uniref:Uncharacterized protein n=1 Tax=Colocasia esculenta TaxID=4460 RepID=A0A843W7K8_COLES|nr:hypothetical protein [Colocasia esculenta]